MKKSLCCFIAGFFCFSTISFSQPLSKDSEQRLLSFCELYSTVKYYYPEPNLQDFPWDAFAYHGYKIAVTSKNDKGLPENEFIYFVSDSPLSEFRIHRLYFP